MAIGYRLCYMLCFVEHALNSALDYCLPKSARFAFLTTRLPFQKCALGFLDDALAFLKVRASLFR